MRCRETLHDSQLLTPSSSYVLCLLDVESLSCCGVLQGDCDWQTVASVELLQAELLHPVEPDAEDGEHRADHGVCHPAFLPAVPV